MLSVMPKRPSGRAINTKIMTMKMTTATPTKGLSQGGRSRMLAIARHLAHANPEYRHPFVVKRGEPALAPKFIRGHEQAELLVKLAELGVEGEVDQDAAAVTSGEQNERKRAAGFWCAEPDGGIQPIYGFHIHQVDRHV